MIRSVRTELNELKLSVNSEHGLWLHFQEGNCEYERVVFWLARLPLLTCNLRKWQNNLGLKIETLIPSAPLHRLRIGCPEDEIPACGEFEIRYFLYE